MYKTLTTALRAGKCSPPLVAGALWTSPAGLRVDGLLGRRFLRGLSLTRLWREGCGGAPLNLWKAPSYEKTIQPPCGRRKCFPPCPLRGISPASGGRITRAYCSATYERIALRSFIVPPLRGGGRWCRKAPKGGEKSHRRWLITVMLIMPYDTENKSRNVLASPLGEEGHEVAKRCTRVRMIMTLDMNVTAERRHYNTHRPLKGKRLTTLRVLTKA